MTEPYWHDERLTVYVGDCRAVMAAMPAESVHCVVTSPPYWGLRDYGTATWLPDLSDERVGREFIARHWEKSTDELRAELEAEAGDCDHRHATEHQKQGATSQRVGRSNTEDQRNENFRDVCGKCGATRVDGQLGLEATPEEYVANMVDVFREVRRVLRSDGTVWLNLGDSYNTYAANRGEGASISKNRHAEGGLPDVPKGYGLSAKGLKQKDLVGIPWRVAFALQADGWYLRSEIIWAKPNPMPESVTDRPTKSHETIFLLSKSPRYYFDADGVREDGAGRMDLGRMKRPEARLGEGGKWADDGGLKDEAGRNIRSVYPDPVPATVLDPFAGSGTTGLVAQSLGRAAILIDLSADYMAQIMKRNAQMPLL